MGLTITSSSGRTPGERAIIATVGVSGMLVPLNSTMIAVALPEITKHVGASVAQSGWLVTAYLITMASFQPIAGKLGDRFGRRPFIVGGVAAFAIASAGAALSASIWTLIAFRGGQAVAGAVVFPNGAALLREIIPVERRGASFGLLGSSVAFGAAIGPPLGGLLLELGGWPAIFWMNVPLCLVILAASRGTIPARRPRSVTSRFDTAGAVLLAGTLAGAAWIIVRLRGTPPALLGGVGALVIAAAVAFVARELAYSDPVMQLRFFRRPAFFASNGAIALSNLAMYALLIAVPLLLGERAGWSHARVGLGLTALSAGLVVFAPVGGRLGDRLGRRMPALIGLSFLSVGMTILAVRGPGISARLLLAVLVLSGAGLGLGSSSIQTAAVESIEPEHAGMAAATSSTSRYIGSIVGTSVLAGLVASGSGFQVLFTLMAISSVASAVFTLGLPASPSRALGRRGADAPV